MEVSAMTEFEANILDGGKLLFEPNSGGLGYEIFHALNRYKGKIVQRIVPTGEVDYYEDLLQRSIRTAIYFKKINLKREDIVCLCCGNIFNSLDPLIASKFVGSNYSSVDKLQPEEDLLYILNFLEPRIIFIEEDDDLKFQEYSKQFQFECEIIVFGKSNAFTNFSQLMTYSEEEVDFRPIFIEDISETAIIFTSSGTTGNAKGICLSHYALLGHIFNVFNASYHRGTMRFTKFTHKFSDADDSKFMFFSPMYWITGTFFSLGMIFIGGSRVVGSLFNADEVWNALEKYLPDTIFLPSGQMSALCRYASNKPPNTSLEIFLTSAIRLTEAHMKKFKKCFPSGHLLQCYGQTENSGLIASFHIGIPGDLKLQEIYSTSCRRPLTGYQIKVKTKLTTLFSRLLFNSVGVLLLRVASTLDNVLAAQNVFQAINSRLEIVSVDKGDICGPMEQGEVLMKNKFIMNGYFKKDSSFAFDADGWFRSGDLGYFDENHFLYILERVDDLVYYKNKFFSPSVVENILTQHPAVLEGFVFGYPHPTDKQHPMAVVVLNEEFKNKVQGDEIVHFVNEKVPDDMYKIRAGVKVVDKLLKTQSSKFKRIPMRRLILAGEF